MKHVLPALMALLFLAISSCKYEPQDIYERNLNQEVEPPTIETIQLDLLPDQDTVLLPYNRVYFNFKSSDQKIKGIKYYLDGELVGMVESGEGSFELNSETITNGLHRLKLEIYTNSGTGSIADSLGIEGFLFTTKEWTIKVLDGYSSGVSTMVEDGFLKLLWPKPYENVVEYIVYREYREIGRTTTCDFIDKAYVGEGANYSVEYINAAVGHKTFIGQVRLPKEIRIKKFNYDTGNNYNILWDQPKYYGAVGTISVFNEEGPFPTVLLEKTSDISKTSFKVPTSSFGQIKRFWITLTPKHPDPYFNPTNFSNSFYSSPIIECIIGYPSPIFNTILPLGSSEFLYHTNMYYHDNISRNDSLFRYSTSQNKINESFRYNPPNYNWSGDHFWNPSTSADGGYYTAHAGLSGTMIVGSGSNLKDYKIIDVSNLTSSTVRIPVSNNGRGIIIAYDKKHLYDFTSQTVLGTVNSTTALDGYNISTNGDYFYLRVSHTIWYYSYLNDQLKAERTISADAYPGYDYFDFMATEPDKAVSWNKNSKLFCILRCSDLEVVNSFTVDGDEILDIDYFNRQILTFSSKRLRVYSLTDGSLLYDIPVDYPYNFYYRCWLSGNSIFHKDGARYFLN